MNNLVDKFESRIVIICRNYKKEVVGIYESIVDAADDFLVDQDEIFEAIDSKKQLLGSGFWSRESVMFMRTDSITSSPSPLRKINYRNRDRGKHKHPGSSVSVVQLEYNTLILVARYDSMYEAFAKTGARNISKCCKGEAQSSGGYKWMFEDEYTELIKDFESSSNDLM